MIIVVLGMACVSLGSLCGICDFIRGLNFTSEVGLRSGKRVLQVFAVVKLCLWTLSASASTIKTAASFHLCDWEKTKRKRRDTQEAKWWRLWLPTGTNPHVLFSNHIQPLTILFSNSMRPSEAHEALPQSCNLSCSRLMRKAGCCWSGWGGSASAGCLAHPSCPPYTGSQVIAQIPHRVCRLYLSTATGRLCKRRNQRRRGRTQKKSLLFQPEVQAFKYGVSRNETNETAARMEGRSAQDWVGSWLHGAVGGGRALREFSLWFF